MANKMNVTSFIVATFKYDAVLPREKLTILGKIKLLKLLHIRPFVLRPLFESGNLITDFFRDFGSKLNRLRTP